MKDTLKRIVRLATKLPLLAFYRIKNLLWDSPIRKATSWKEDLSNWYLNLKEGLSNWYLNLKEGLSNWYLNLKNSLKDSLWDSPIQKAASWREGVNNWYLNKPVWDWRTEEYRHALHFMSDCRNILDVGCGTGTFLEEWSYAGKGIDINRENVAYCQERGLDVTIGSALDLPFANNSFDGVHCSHLMQVFMPDDAASLIRELCRVVHDKGIIVITTLNWFPRFFRHPENARPYPPDAILRLNSLQSDVSSTSPMYHSMPNITQEAIWLRRPPLIEFKSTIPERDMYLWRLNPLQMKYGVRKFWEYEAFTMKLRVHKGDSASQQDSE